MVTHNARGSVVKKEPPEGGSSLTPLGVFSLPKVGTIMTVGNGPEGSYF
jgi:hypothetical protein